MPVLDWKAGARKALIKAGAIKSCDRHFDVFIRTNEENSERSAQAVATNMLKVGDVRTGPRAEFLSAVAAMLAETPDACFICEAAKKAKAK